ncbi:MAG TPA: Crp/Fnr family transcriptional regulator [Acetobacteraceae bacterium]|nr:Crp/Fnr family transcriptional regulator [Acetobacteraceae bacterium]
MALQDPPPRNRLLAALPPADLAAFRAQLEPVELAFDTTLLQAHSAWRSVIFVESGMVSLIATLAEGEQVEVGVIGSEGLLGLPVILADGHSTVEARVQLEGRGLRLGAEATRAAMERSPAFRSLVLRYAQARHDQVTQTAACNTYHSAEERLARWLLIAHDRAGADSFAMTHEFMAMMLGLRRPAVSLTAAALQRAGLIQYRRGQMTVADRPGLEAAACECYDTTRNEFRRLLGSAVG